MECLLQLLLFGPEGVVFQFAEIQRLKLNITIILCFVLCGCATFMMCSAYQVWFGHLNEG